MLKLKRPHGPRAVIRFQVRYFMRCIGCQLALTWLYPDTHRVNGIPQLAKEHPVRGESGRFLRDKMLSKTRWTQLSNKLPSFISCVSGLHSVT